MRSELEGLRKSVVDLDKRQAVFKSIDQVNKTFGASVSDVRAREAEVRANADLSRL